MQHQTRLRAEATKGRDQNMNGMDLEGLLDDSNDHKSTKTLRGSQQARLDISIAPYPQKPNKKEHFWNFLKVAYYHFVHRNS